MPLLNPPSNSDAFPERTSSLQSPDNQHPDHTQPSTDNQNPDDNRPSIGNTMAEADLVIIGAGVYGLAAGKAYRQVHPDANIIMLETAKSLGGTWAKHRIYQNLKTNTPFGGYEFSDYPMLSEKYKVYPGECIPGAIVHQYLTDFAKHFKIFECIRFGMTVKAVKHLAGKQGGWVLTVVKDQHPLKLDNDGFMHAKKLIVATGLTSEPHWPNFTGKEVFPEPQVHSKFLPDAHRILSSDKIAQICVIGGAKSAWDAVYTYASQGKQIDWVVRKSGHGPNWIYDSKLSDAMTSRKLALYSPCIWETGLVRKFLHGTKVGRGIVDKFWKEMEDTMLDSNPYDDTPQNAKLVPTTNLLFEGASGFSLLNYDHDFFELIKNKGVQIHNADVLALSKGTVHLTNGEEFPSQALIFCTGWKYAPPFAFHDKATLDLGIPGQPIYRRGPSQSLPYDDQLFKVTQKARSFVLDRLPRLATPPVVNNKFDTAAESMHTTSFNLYRFMVPCSMQAYKDIAFVGALTHFSATCCAQAQALWVTAYFTGDTDVFGVAVNLPKKGEAGMKKEAARDNQWARLRSPLGVGAVVPDLAADSLPYIDLLLKDLNLRYLRKGGFRGYLSPKEMSESYGPADYKGIVEEWIARRKYFS